MIKNGKYKDNNGNIYNVIGIAKNKETEKELVVYKDNHSDELFVMSIVSWKSSTFNYAEEYLYNVSNNANKNLVKLYKVITDYLLSIVPKEITIDKLNEYFISYKCKTFEDLYVCFFSTLQDYQFLPNVIGFNNQDRRPIFKKILLDFDGNKILKKYNEESLFKEFCKNFPVKNIDSKSNSWRRYAASIISVCKYISQFETIDDFNNYCKSYDGSYVLPEEMKSKIKGMGFALACNLLKDIGFMDYSKPDVHLKDVLSLTGYCNKDDYSVFDCVRQIAKANNVKPFEVDSKIWLICSGYYYKHGVNTVSHKNDLIEKIKNEIE